MATDVTRLDLNEWRRGLAGTLVDAFGGSPDVSLLCAPKDVADDTLKLLVRDPGGRPRGVLICSSFVEPDGVAVGMENARLARRALDEDLKEFVLEPLLEGRYCGLSYALLPYCESLSKSRIVNRIQRTALAPALFRWLRRSTEVTMAEPVRLDYEIAAALESLEATERMPHRVRSAAEWALDRINMGVWTPRRVLMHGDFWIGNILVRSKELLGGRRRPWWDRFVIIDWGSSRSDGFAFWDLFRFAHSVGASSRRLSTEIAARARVLGCDPRDARSYLAAALGDLGRNLNHFPFERYAQLADSVIGDVDRALSPR